MYKQFSVDNLTNWFSDFLPLPPEALDIITSAIKDCLDNQDKKYDSLRIVLENLSDENF